jgi:SAM-dependent methyltransferase
MNVERYWRSLVNPTSTDALELVGHPDMGRAFNQQAYKVRLASLDRALETIGVRPDWSVFEAAYGVGFYLAGWHRRGQRRVTGVDLAPGAHAVATRAFPAYDLRVGDISSLSQWGDWEALRSSFDLVTAIDVVYHVIDDERARCAVLNLGRLVAPGGYLIVTDKFEGLSEPVRESAIVTRRPLRWYSDVLAPVGLEVAHTFPMMLFSDPPSRYGGPAPMRLAARLAWLAARAPLTHLPTNGAVQRRLGAWFGASLAAADLRVLPHLRAVPNLMIAIFRRQQTNGRGEQPSAKDEVL